MPDVFISYSRRNLDFVNQLVYALKWRGKDPWFDQLKEPLSGIAAGAPWWKQIQEGIESVDNFLFTISPHSISSPYCHAEINHAREHGKRLVPLLYCGTTDEGETRQAIDAAIEAIPDDQEIPDSVTSSILNLKKLVRANWLAISDIQYVVFASTIPFEQSLEQLVQALDLDLAWVRMHSQITQAARLWEANDFHEDYLWGAIRLKPVYDMLARRKPTLDPLVQEFIEPEQERLLRELEALPRTAESHGRRRDIGDRLGVIGDPRSGVGVKDGIPDMEWLPVTPGGEIMIANETLTVKPFYIAKYQVTYAQYQAFVDAEDGFHNPQWWRGIPLQHEKRLPVMPQFIKSLNNPRDNISWYQAVAFARWLNERYQARGLLPEPLVWGAAQTGVMQRLLGGSKGAEVEKWQIRLPTEWEWQWAAQNGHEQREYPWGTLQEGYANISEAGIGRAIAVGMYPHGAAACGALDMAGNLWEWCLNDYNEIEQIGLHRDNKMKRGGSFLNYQVIAAASYRGSFGESPQYFRHEHGFRVVVSSPIQEL